MFINPKQCRGFTLLEMLIAMGIAGIIFAVITSVVLFSSRSFASMSNYAELNQKSMRALDIITRELRQAKGIDSITSSKIDFDGPNGENFSINYYANRREVVLIGQNGAEVLLKDCDSFEALGYDRNFNEVSGSTTKMVQIRWECYRDVYVGDKLTTESVQTARVVMRHNSKNSL